MKNIFYKMPRGARFIFVFIMSAVFLAVISMLVMQLWNNILPQIIHVEPINFWEAGGIFVLCKILFGFGRMGGFGQGKGQWKDRLAERVQTMTPEERERFKDKLSNRKFDWCEKPKKADETNTTTG
jgi:hypothetical protein